jgi:hypothetical protein
MPGDIWGALWTVGAGCGFSSHASQNRSPLLDPRKAEQAEDLLLEEPVPDQLDPSPLSKEGEARLAHPEELTHRQNREKEALPTVNVSVNLLANETHLT